MIECCGNLVGVVNRLALAAPARLAWVFLGNLDARALGQQTRSIRKFQVLQLHHEADRVAAFSTSEALEEAAIGMNVERRCFLAVKWAQTYEVTSALVKRDILTDQSRKIGSCENLAHHRLVDPHRVCLRAGPGLPR